MSEQEKKDLTREAKTFAKWFKIEFTLSIFGQTLIHWVYPPQKEE